MDGHPSVIISLVCVAPHSHVRAVVGKLVTRDRRVQAAFGHQSQTSPTVYGHKSQSLHSSTLQVNLQVEEKIVCCAANFYIASEQCNPSCVMESHSVW
mmetsp:Transcript_41028/g.131936  ORF Transcript_41028/g.131936 Transcript_41028/m.131936 type:complete len:98 (-) Transcript_41028:42-335(-)